MLAKKNHTRYYSQKLITHLLALNNNIYAKNTLCWLVQYMVPNKVEVSSPPPPPPPPIQMETIRPLKYRWVSPILKTLLSSFADQYTAPNS